MNNSADNTITTGSGDRENTGASRTECFLCGSHYNPEPIARWKIVKGGLKLITDSICGKCKTKTKVISSTEINKAG